MSSNSVQSDEVKTAAEEGAEPNKSVTQASSSTTQKAETPSPKRDLRFWLIFVALCCCTLLSAIDLSGVGTAAPTIVHSLRGNSFAWVFSAYALSSSACMPLSGNLAQIFGRRPILQLGIVVFAAGSAISGSASTMTVLIVGRAGLAFALLYEAKWAAQPAVPWVVLANRTSISGCASYVGTFVAGMANICLGYYLLVYFLSRLNNFVDQDASSPTWFQAVQGASPVTAGLHFMPWAVAISGFAIVGGIVVAKIGKYKIVNLVAWCILLLGMGLLITLKLDTSIGLVILYELIMGVAGGLLYTSAAWGVAVGGTVFQTALKRKLPSSLVNQFPSNVDIAYYIVSEIPSYPEPLKHEVQTAFLESFRVLWIAAEIMVAIGALTVPLMKDLPLRRTVDKDWGIKKQQEEQMATENGGQGLEEKVKEGP
ncbi:hypothetical protein H0H93_015434 [Arthromyces matolae]|nr:hypothetical protein H0H93_015434 [Arthromyces matolae]